MRKYDVLKLIFESSNGVTARDISNTLGTSIPNVYTYLKELDHEEFVKKGPTGRYIVNRTNENLQFLLELQAMAPEKFHVLINPSSRKILTKLCQTLQVKRNAFSPAEIGRVEGIAIPLRIVLKLSKRPSSYCLKINESLVRSLLGYHSLRPDFSLTDFQTVIENVKIRKQLDSGKTVESEPEVIEMCDKLYASGGDMAVLLKSKTFAPDARLLGLLMSAEHANKEYALFLNALDLNVKKTILDQWKNRYIYNTNSIEGNTMSEKDVNDYFKKGKIPSSITKRELHETNNLRHALDFLRLKRSERLSEELIQEVHFMVQKEIEENAGEYKKFYNYVRPDSPTTPPQHVKERMRALVDWYKQNEQSAHPLVLASIFHMQFEVVHPFGDGNGRVGRLLMNFILEQKGYSPITIFEKNKQSYYRALENRSLPQFLDYALASFMEEYKR
ncbi:Fic/DOC family protein [uncultured archaeon]|nr:Fic/DOC family protein [uncultured archaeon]